MQYLSSSHYYTLPLFFFFFNDTATTEIYTLSLHDALPIYPRGNPRGADRPALPGRPRRIDRKSTRLNSSHVSSSYAVFCLKKKTTTSDERPAFCTICGRPADEVLTLIS